MSSSSSTKICYNPDCKESILERSRKGWRLRSGDFVELCGRCASAFEDGRFCKTFHANSAGWRNCESCGKSLHCGCIVSVHEFVLLDVGGVECMPCASKHLIKSSNQIWPSPSSFLPRALSERLKDFPVIDWNVVDGSNAVAGQWWRPPNMQISASIKSDLHQRMSHDVERLSVSSKEKGKHEVPSERLTSRGLELAAPGSRTANCNSGDVVSASNAFNKEEGLTAHPDSGVIISRQPCTSKDDSSTAHIGAAVTYTSSIDANGPTRVSETQSQRQTPPSPLVKQFNGHSQNGVDSSGEIQVRNGKQRGDARGKAQLLPRYWPRITDQELQQISGDSNSVITPLFEKMLSASDAGRIGRLVLPKKCAEAYFPAISQSEGLPLKVQDAKGKEWTFQFRFWPNNNSRMYVLEGVTPCIQSMQLQAGDTVTFSRIDPEGKLVMGFRKASSNVPSDQVPSGNRTPKTANGISTNAEVNSTHPASTWSKVDKSAYIAKEMQSVKSSLIPSKRKSSTLGSKSKRLRIENEDLIEIKLTWEQAQGLLRPPPSHAPSIVVIEGHEFEEYEEAPILGKPTVLATNNIGEKIQWIQCEDCSKWRKLPVDALLPSRWTCSDNKWDPKRSSCSSDQEIATEQVENLLACSNADASKKMKSARKDSDEVEPSDGLDTLADLAIMGESKVSSSSAQPTTRHPRHRPGCTCIVCIQPPSGKGPKHRETCTCNVCLTVKRRFRTLMERRGKRQPEKDGENSQKKYHHQQQPEKLEAEDDLAISSNASSNNNIIPKIEANGTIADDDYNRKKQLSPFKGQIDLNIQPEREDEPSPLADPGSMMRLLRNATDQYLRQQRLASSASDRDLKVNKVDLSGAVPGENNHETVLPRDDDQVEVELDCPVPLSMSVSASTSATG